MPANFYFLTNYQERVVSLRLYVRSPSEERAVPLNISSQEACELAAWIVVTAGLGKHMNVDEARAYFDGAFRQALGDDDRAAGDAAADSEIAHSLREGGCRCVEIMRADADRHFKGCPLREGGTNDASNV